jgi:hypothetical protein
MLALEFCRARRQLVAALGWLAHQPACGVCNDVSGTPAPTLMVHVVLLLNHNVMYSYANAKLHAQAFEWIKSSALICIEGR